MKAWKSEEPYTGFTILLKYKGSTMNDVKSLFLSTYVCLFSIHSQYIKMNAMLLWIIFKNVFHTFHTA